MSNLDATHVILAALLVVQSLGLGYMVWQVYRAQRLILMSRRDDR